MRAAGSMLAASAPRDGDAAGQDHALIAILSAGELLQTVPDEAVDVAMIVREQNPRLDVAPVAAGVMDETAQGVIDPDRVEQRQGLRLLRRSDPEAVGDLVTHHREQRDGEVGRQVARRDPAAREVGAGLQHIGIGNLLGAQADFEGGTVIPHQGRQLLQQIRPEMRRLRHRGGVGAGRLELRRRAGKTRDRPGRVIGDP